MADYGVTAQGFLKKTREVIEADLRLGAQNLFGPDINLSSYSPLGILVKLVSWVASLIWEVLEGVYNSAYVSTAWGASLYALGKYIGISPKPAEKYIFTETFTGDPGTIIEEGFVVETPTTVPIGFETMESGTIGAGGTVNIPISCLQAGLIGNVALGTITVIKNPISGLESVSNTALITQGRDQETDEQFRDRYEISVSKAGASTLDSIRSALLGVDGVLAALVYENDTLSTDENGRPPKSIECVVYGGLEANIGLTILNTKAAGIQPFGTQSVVVLDSAGISRIIKYSQAVEVPIYLIVDLSINAAFPTNGDNLIKDSIIEYIGGTDTNSNPIQGLSMAENVIHAKVIDRCFNITGVSDVSVKLGTSSNPTNQVNISIGYNQVAKTDSIKVVVNHV